MTANTHGLELLWGRRKATEVNAVTATSTINLNATKTMSAMRIAFGAIFLFDGILKWLLIYNGQMQAVVSNYGYDYLTNTWLTVGILVGLGETLAGIALLVGLFQRPAAVVAAGIMLAIWGYGGFGNFTQPGYTDPGGDLMLAIVFAFLIFAPYAYGLAYRLNLRDRWPGSSIKERTLRFLVT